MNTDQRDWRAEVLAANKEVHGRLATIYDQTEPHFRPENQTKVKGRLQAVRDRAGRARLLDVGCGTGFILRLAADLFDQIDGVDITQEMIARIPDLGSHVRVQLAEAEKLPFDGNTFDVVTAYSVFDHLVDYRVTLKEILRVLKPGGIFYADLIPNREFWQTLIGIPINQEARLDPIVTRELNMVRENDKRIEKEYGIPADKFRIVEPGKLDGGIDGPAVCAEAKNIGYSKQEVLYDWFLGQGPVMHMQSFEDAATIDAYLQRLGSLSRPLYKYLRFVLTK